MNKKFIVLFIVLSHLTGFFGLLFLNSRALFLWLTPFHLIFMLILSLESIKPISWRFWIDMVLLILCTFVLEFLGVKTGLIFGNYHYGHTLGLNLWGVPLLIGVNWFILILSSQATVRIIFQRQLSSFWRAILSAITMVLMDILIEPVAIYLHYWYWNLGVIPFQNYVAWFIFSFIFQFFYSKRNLSLKSIPLAIMFLCQAVFFLALHLFLIPH